MLAQIEFRRWVSLNDWRTPTRSWRTKSCRSRAILHRSSFWVRASISWEEQLIEAATERARLDIISAKAAAERVEQNLGRTSRERLLPDEKTLENVARYEAHLPRLFHKALHELEALQTRRSGGVPPLARLDVQVSED